MSASKIELGELESEKRAILERAEAWSEDRLAWRPADSEWSAAEILDHIEKVESGILNAAARGLKEPHAVGLRDRAGFLLLDRIFQSQRRVRVPAAAAAVLPARDVTLDDIRERWERTRQRLSILVSEVTADQLTVGVFRHPVSGWMTLPQVIRFFTVHIQHHGFQFDRLSKAWDTRQI